MVTKTQQEFLLGALIGGAIGAATALFLTPLSGAALRHQMTTGFGHLNGASPKPRPKAKAKSKVRKAGSPTKKAVKKIADAQQKNA